MKNEMILPIVAYGDANNYIETVVLTVSGTAITKNTPTTITAEWASNIKIAALTTTTAVVVYPDYSYYTNLVWLSITGTTVTATDTKEADTKVIYYPFYKTVLKREGIDRELYINGVTGKVLWVIKWI